MTKAPYIAKEYIQYSKRLNDNEIEKVMENYEGLNKIGIPMTNFQLVVSTLVKIIIYCIIAIL